ncbi:unnamed protein product [Prunus brigantina]
MSSSCICIVSASPNVEGMVDRFRLTASEPPCVAILFRPCRPRNLGGMAGAFFQRLGLIFRSDESEKDVKVVQEVPLDGGEGEEATTVAGGEAYQRAADKWPVIELGMKATRLKVLKLVAPSASMDIWLCMKRAITAAECAKKAYDDGHAKFAEAGMVLQDHANLIKDKEALERQVKATEAKLAEMRVALDAAVQAATRDAEVAKGAVQGFTEEMIEDYVGEDGPPLSSAEVEVAAGGRDNAEDAVV